jgi:hypothetical protein
MKQRLVELHKETERLLLDSPRTEEFAAEERVIEVIERTLSNSLKTLSPGLK